MMSEIHIKGGKELNAILQKLPVSIEKNILRSALSQGAKQYAEKAKSLVNVDDGDLKDSIRVSSNYKAGRVTAKVKAGNKKVWYALIHEFGAAAHLIKPKRKKVLRFNGGAFTSVNHTGFAPQPFMRPAFDTQTNDALRAIGNQIRKRLTKAGVNTPAISFGDNDG